jgi:predicted DNA-binding transcriptional regulator AlpA
MDNLGMVVTSGSPRALTSAAGTDMDNIETLLISREAAKLLRLSERTVERHRVAGTGPRFIRLGRAIRYRRRDLLDWIERAARHSTSEPEV